MLDQPNLTTPRLHLRLPTAQDIPAIIAIAGNLVVARNLVRVPHPYGEADARFFLDHIVPAEWTWAITRHGDETLIGMIGLSPTPADETAELGYWLSPAHWRQGIATEAARAVIAFAFDTLALPALTTRCFTVNPVSAHILTGLGFHQTGEETTSCSATGQDMSSVAMRLPAPPQQPRPPT